MDNQYTDYSLPDLTEALQQPRFVCRERFGNFGHVWDDGAFQGRANHRTINPVLAKEEVNVIPVLGIHAHHLRQNQVCGGGTEQLEVAKAKTTNWLDIIEPGWGENHVSTDG